MKLNPMRKILSILLVLIASFLLIKIAFADNNKCADPTSLGLDDIQKCLNDLNQAKQSSINATTPLITQVNGIKNRIAVIENDLIIKKKNIDDGYKNLAKQQKILNAAIRDYYIKSYYDSPLTVFLSTNNASDITQILTYQKKVTDQDKIIITNISLSIQSLQKQQDELKQEQVSLASVKVSLDKIIAQATAYQNTLSGQISALSAKQQQILSERLASLNIPLTAYTTQGGCSSDLTNGKDPGFSGGFGFFTYGVPNRVGLNQYGAWGRAKAGQSYDTILHAYYNFDSIETKNAQINVNGYGSYSLEDYVKRVYEVPDSWTDNNLAALKAQAIAARSYVLAYTNNGAGSICTTEQCQVFKPDPKGGNWEQAVNATAGQVMVQGGTPIKAWFSSTHGGYIFTSSDIGWSATSYTKNGQDTTGGVSSFGDLQSNSYDKGSPWFYCDWGGRSAYGGTAWLKSDEVADIVNVLLLVGRDGGTKEHMYQTDKPNRAGTDTWDAERVKQELRNRGGNPFNSVSSISVGTDFGRGVTTSVNVSGDGGGTTFSGSDFKTYFNLRAPASINIVGPLYNVERK